MNVFSKIILSVMLLTFNLNAFNSFFYRADAQYQRQKRLEAERKNRELEEKLKHQEQEKVVQQPKDDFHDFVDNFEINLIEITDNKDKLNHKRRFVFNLTGPDPITDFKITIVDLNQNVITKVKVNKKKEYIFFINEKRKNIQALMEYKDRSYSYYDFVQTLNIGEN